MPIRLSSSLPLRLSAQQGAPNDDHTAIEVVSRHGNVVILSKDDYDAMTETAYLLRNPANVERLLSAIERARRGEFEQHDVLDA